jgi:hypothetical protein
MYNYFSEEAEKFATILPRGNGFCTKYDIKHKKGYSDFFGFINIKEENNYFQIDTDNDFDKSEKYDFKVRFFEDPEKKFKVIFLKTFNFSNYLKLHNYVEDAVSYSIYSYVEKETGRHED